MQIDFGLFRLRFVRPTAILVSVGPTTAKSVILTEGTGSMDLKLGDNQRTRIRLQALDAAGLAGSFANPPKWSVDDPTVVAITPDADGTSCLVEAASPPKLGNAVVTAADSDDPNVPPLTFNVSVVAEQVSRLGFTVDPVEEKPAAAPASDPNAAPVGA